MHVLGVNSNHIDVNGSRLQQVDRGKGVNGSVNMETGTWFLVVFGFAQAALEQVNKVSSLQI